MYTPPTRAKITLHVEFDNGEQVKATYHDMHADLGQQMITTLSQSPKIKDDEDGE